MTAVDIGAASLAEAVAHRDDDELKHAEYLRDRVRPLMEQLRSIGDELEMLVAAGLWRLPTYREMLLSR